MAHPTRTFRLHPPIVPVDGAVRDFDGCVAYLTIREAAEPPREHGLLGEVR